MTTLSIEPCDPCNEVLDALAATAALFGEAMTLGVILTELCPDCVGRLVEQAG